MIQRVSVGGHRFHHWQCGEGEDVVMIHGVGANLAIWHFTIAAHLLASCRLTMYDLRGHGRSDVPPTGYGVHTMADDLRGILDALGLGQVSLVGHSYGADIALHLTLRHPDRVRRVVAIEAGLPSLFNARRELEWNGWKEWTQLLENEAGIRKEPGDWHRIYTSLRSGEPLPEYEFLRNTDLPPKGRRLVRLLEETSLVRDYEESSAISRESLSDLACPVLLLYGARSSYRPTMDVLCDTLPCHTALLVPGADHFNLLKPEIAAPIREFLQHV